MGNTTSAKSEVNNLSKTISDISMQVIQDCVVNSTQNQNVNLSNSGFRLFGTTNIEQETTINSSCFSDTRRQTTLQNEIANNILNSTTSDGVALWPAFGSTKSAAQTTINNLIKTHVNMDSIQRNYNSIIQNLNVNASNSGVELGMTYNIKQGATIFAAATLKQVTSAGVFNRVSSYVEQSAAAKTSGPFDFIGNIATAFIVFFVVIMVIFLAYLFRSYR